MATMKCIPCGALPCCDCWMPKISLAQLISVSLGSCKRESESGPAAEKRIRGSGVSWIDCLTTGTKTHFRNLYPYCCNCESCYQTSLLPIRGAHWTQGTGAI